MAEDRQWLTPKEVAKAIGPEQTKKLLEDLAYNRKDRREILDGVMRAAHCVEYSATDFIREILKNPKLGEESGE